MAESNSEESKKVEDRINALTSQFKQLQDVSQRRMARLKQAVVDSTKFEGQCEKLEEWLKEAESQMKDMPPFSMLSQPLSTQLELVEVRKESCFNSCLSFVLYFPGICNRVSTKTLKVIRQTYLLLRRLKKICLLLNFLLLNCARNTSQLSNPLPPLVWLLIPPPQQRIPL